MSRPRKPNAVLEMNGAFAKNPQRRRADPKSSGPVGPAPAYLNEQETELWNQFKRKAPEKVLTAADSFLLEIVCKLMARMRYPVAPCPECQGEDCKVCNGKRFILNVPLGNGELNALMQGISRLGFTPVDRAKISPTRGSGEKKEGNPFTKFKSG
jgi:phage terminase small subunit